MIDFYIEVQQQTNVLERRTHNKERKKERNECGTQHMTACTYRVRVWAWIVERWSDYGCFS